MGRRVDAKIRRIRDVDMERQVKEIGRRERTYDKGKVMYEEL